MSFTPLMMKLVVSLLDELGPSPSVVELGNQTFDPTLRMSNTHPKDEMLPLVISYLEKKGRAFDREKLKALRSMSPEEVKPHTATYYKAIGFSEYVAIDVNSTYGSLVMDLNVDLRDRYAYNRTFDFVTNNGTGEHIFNQFAVFKNMHDLTKVGGVMLFVLPFYNWMNHGFFSFHPILFADLATANSYRIVRLSIAGNVGLEFEAKIDGRRTGEIRFDWEPSDPELTVSEFQRRGAISPVTMKSLAWVMMKYLTGSSPGKQMSRLPGAVATLAERSANINVVAALRKNRAEPFKLPLQGMYAGANVEDANLSKSYPHQVA
jgi:hypothetical protein